MKMAVSDVECSESYFVPFMVLPTFSVDTSSNDVFDIGQRYNMLLRCTPLQRYRIAGVS